MRNSSNTQSLGAHFKGDSPKFKNKFNTNSRFVGEVLGAVHQEPGEDNTNSSSQTNRTPAQQPSVARDMVFD